MGKEGTEENGTGGEMKEKDYHNQSRNLFFWGDRLSRQWATGVKEWNIPAGTFMGVLGQNSWSKQGNSSLQVLWKVDFYIYSESKCEHQWGKSLLKAANHSAAFDLGLSAPNLRDVSQHVHLLWHLSLDTHCGLQGTGQDADLAKHSSYTPYSSWGALTALENEVIGKVILKNSQDKTCGTDRIREAINL